METSRFTKALQDNEGHDYFVRSEWARLSNDLFRERGLWASSRSENKWRLDYTEGRHRMRKKLQPITDTQAHQYMPKQKRSHSDMKAEVGLQTRTFVAADLLIFR